VIIVDDAIGRTNPMEGQRMYKYREGANGEYCIDYGYLVFERRDTLGRTATKDEAVRLVKELNELVVFVEQR
jgi:hypothetical protein